MSELVLLCGIPGSGKSTYCSNHLPNHVRVSRDSQGHDGHKRLFHDSLAAGHDIVVDKVNFNQEQRKPWIDAARAAGYTVRIVHIDADRLLCEKRAARRTDHPTVDPSKVNPAHIISKFKGMWQEPSKKECDVLDVVRVPNYAIVDDISHLKGRIAVFGDLHGLFEPFIKALVQLNPNYIVLCGDMNDRGPDYVKLQRFAREKHAKGKLFAVEGNHEKALLKAMNMGKKEGSHGLTETLAQVGSLDDEEREALRLYLQKLPGMLKLPMGRWVVHAGVDPRRVPHRQSYETAVYARRLGGVNFTDKSAPWWFQHEWDQAWQDQVVLFGHSFHADPYVCPNAVSLDGNAVYGKKLRCYLMDTETSEVELHSFDSPQYAEEDPSWYT